MHRSFQLKKRGNNLLNDIIGIQNMCWLKFTKNDLMFAREKMGKLIHNFVLFHCILTFFKYTQLFQK